MIERLLSAAEAADILGVSLKSLSAHVQSGELPYVSVGTGKIRETRAFMRSDLEAFIDNRRTTMQKPSKGKPAQFIDATDFQRRLAERHAKQAEREAKRRK